MRIGAKHSVYWEDEYTFEPVKSYLPGTLPALRIPHLNFLKARHRHCKMTGKKKKKQGSYSY